MTPAALPASLGRLATAKGIANTALRWVPPFLPTLERAFGASTTQLTTILGASEMAGFSTVVVGRHLDRGRERVVVTIGLVAVAVASLVALVGTTFSFAVGSVLVVLGVANCTVAGHAFISHRVAYGRRARAIGLFETSWAVSLLVGAPLIAVLISIFGWRGPYVALAIAATVIAVLIARSASLSPPRSSAVPGDAHRADDADRADDAERDTAGADDGDVHGHGPALEPVGPATFRALTPAAWLVVAGSSFLAIAGLSVFAISGTWLDDAFGLSTGGLGAVAMGFGAIELVSSLSSATFADRIGKLRSTVGGLGLLLVGLTVMSIADATLWIGVVGILTFLCGFEFAIVTSFSLVSEAMPQARGTMIALSSGVGTLARGSGTIVGGWLYGIHGVEGTLTLSAVAAVLSATAFVASRVRVG